MRNAIARGDRALTTLFFSPGIADTGLKIKTPLYHLLSIYVNLLIMNSLLGPLQNEISRCLKCGICMAECPTYIATRDESMVARGRLALVEAVVDGKLNASEKYEDILSKCTSCLSCVSNCPCGIDPVKIFNAAKGEYFSKNGSDLITKIILKYFVNKERPLYPLFKLMGMANKMLYERIPAEGWLKELLPFFRDGFKKSLPPMGTRNLKNEVPEIIKTKNPVMRVVFFTGCMTDFVYPNVGHDIINILKANNIETIIPKNITCCGAPAYYLGDHVTALNLAEKNHEILSQLNPDYIITSCATCGKVLKSVYSILLNKNGDFKNFSEKVIDIHKFITTHIAIKNKTNSTSKVKVTYHDPCHLKRGQGVFLEPREILKSLPWVEFIEMDEPDACCGGAGGFNLKHYDLSLKIGKRKVDSIKRTGADIVVTGCPSCQMQLMDLLNRANYNRPVLHTVELLNGLPSNSE